MQFRQGLHHRYPNVGVILCRVFFEEKPTKHTIIGIGEGGIDHEMASCMCLFSSQLYRSRGGVTLQVL
uniref:Uncharacterized protein n=1 Tax=Oryza punctata TaxID=4537 RepID=A0A0E0L414_ORYPU